MSEEKAKLRLLAPQFVVPDVVKAAEFYRDSLGFEILGYFLDPPVFAMVRRDNVHIHLGKADGETIQHNDDVRKGMGTDAYIYVSDIAALESELKEKCVEIVCGPVERPYGRTEITVKDLYGFQIVFAF